MKRLLLALLVVLGIGGFVAAPVPVLAQTNVLDPVCNTTQFDRPAVCEDNAANVGQDPLFGPTGVLTKVAQILTIILGIVSVFVLIIAGLRMVASNGDSNTVATMQKAIIAAVAGLALASASQAIITFVLSKI